MATGLAWRGTFSRSEDTVRPERKGPVYFNKDNVVRTTHAQRSKIFLDAAVSSGLITRPKGDSTQPLKKSAVWYSSLKEDADFVRLLGCGVEDAHFLLLVALLPKLRRLWIDGLSPYPLLDWYHFLSRSTTAFRCVEGLSLHGSFSDVTEPFVSLTLQILDIMPSLDALGIGNIAVKSHQFGLQSIPSKVLSRIWLTNSAIGLRLLGKLLREQPLTRLAYIASHNRASIVPNSTCTFTDITKLLDASKTTLKYLAINPTECSEGNNPMWSDFNGLETLELPQHGLMNIDPEEVDPAVVAEELRKQVPGTSTALALRHLEYEPQVKIILEQLVLLKAEGTLPALESVLRHFSRSAPSFTYEFSSFGPPVSKKWLSRHVAFLFLLMEWVGMSPQ